MNGEETEGLVLGLVLVYSLQGSVEPRHLVGSTLVGPSITSLFPFCFSFIYLFIYWGKLFISLFLSFLSSCSCGWDARHT